LIPDGGCACRERQQRLPAQQGMESWVNEVVFVLVLAAALLGAVIIVSRV
jgi:hypothetical protein